MIDKFIWLIINYILLIDSINGFLLYEGLNLPLSQFIKILLILLISIRLANYRYGIYVILVLCYSLLLFSYWASFCPNLIGESFNSIFKFLSVILIFLYIKKSITLYPEQIFKKTHKAITINAVILSINIILGVLGIGYAQYDGEIGSRGFFYSGNEISGVMLIIFPYLLYYVKHRHSGLSGKYIIVSVTLLAVALLATTKTAILGCVIAICLIPRLCTILHSQKKKRKYLLPIILLTISCILYYGLKDSGIWERWSFLYEKDGLTGLLLSGRNIIVANKMGKYLETDSIHKILGMGHDDGVEIDPFDTLFYYGIIGVIIVYGFYIYLLFKANTYRQKGYHPYASLAWLVDFLILSASSLAGHIIFSGMSSIFIALINGLTFYKKSISTNARIN